MQHQHHEGIQNNGTRENQMVFEGERSAVSPEVSEKMRECTAILSGVSGAFEAPDMGAFEASFLPFQFHILARYMVLWLQENPDATRVEVARAEDAFLEKLGKISETNVGALRRLGKKAAKEPELFTQIKKIVTGEEKGISSQALMQFIESSAPVVH